MSSTDPYVIPRDVSLSHPDLAVALAAVGIDACAPYRANGALTHHYRDRLNPPRRLSVVASGRSKHLVEVVGDTTLWLLVRETARTVCAAPALSASSPLRANSL